MHRLKPILLFLLMVILAMTGLILLLAEPTLEEFSLLAFLLVKLSAVVILILTFYVYKKLTKTLDSYYDEDKIQ